MIGNGPSPELVAAANSTLNALVKQVIGNKDDETILPPGEGSLYLLAGFIADHHIHSPSIVYPRDAGPVNITAGVGAWTEGSKVQVIPVDTIAEPYDVHHILLGNISANDDYVLKIYKGAPASEIFVAETAFTRDTNQVRGSSVPIQCPVLPLGTRLSATLMSGSGSNNVDVKAYIHEY